jgi:4-hydroxy-tetrahydrodipicolinate synthase
MDIKKKYSGVIVPMVTPFNQELKVDLGANERILDSFLKTKHVSPFLLGTTGESVSIPDSQKKLIVQSTVKFINGRLPVYAGISGNCFFESVESAKLYAGIGVDAVVAHLPFYYPLNNDQMLQYFTKLADIVPVPLMLYNIPVTTKQSIPLEVIEKLSYHPNIVGIKDSERGIERLDQSLALWKKRTDFVHVMGAAVQSAHALLNGSDGIVPSTGNLTPELYSRMYEAALAGNSQQVEELQQRTNVISEVYQKDRLLSQSIPALKVMMSEFGLCKPYAMPPMQTASDAEMAIIRAQMRAIGLQADAAIC